MPKKEFKYYYKVVEDGLKRKITAVISNVHFDKVADREIKQHFPMQSGESSFTPIMLRFKTEGNSVVVEFELTDKVRLNFIETMIFIADKFLGEYKG